MLISNLTSNLETVRKVKDINFVLSSRSHTHTHTHIHTRGFHPSQPYAHALCLLTSKGREENVYF